MDIVSVVYSTGDAFLSAAAHYWIVFVVLTAIVAFTHDTRTY